MVKASCGQSSTTSSPNSQNIVSDTTTTSSTSTSTSTSSKYKGVRKRKWGKWVSEIRLPNSRERIWLGSYESAEKAARAFDAALYCLRGRDAKFNFPQNPPEIVGGRSLNPQEIQTVAARFANDEVDKTTHNHNIIDSNIVNHESHQYSRDDNNNIARTEQQYTSSSSASVSDWRVAATQVGQSSHETMMDWSFLSTLDTNSQLGMSDYDFFNYPAPAGAISHLPAAAAADDDQLVYPPPTDDDQNGGDGFSQPSFLWNF